MDKLSFLRGKDFYINDNIIIRNPTLGEIQEYGEEKFWQLVTTLNASSFDYRFQLDDVGLDYTEVEDFTVFCTIITSLPKEDTEILFGDLDFTKFNVVSSDGYDEILLYDADNDIRIDSIIYELIVKNIRDTYGLTRNYKVAGNKMARKFYMDEERKRLANEVDKEYESFLGDMISAMVNIEGFKYNYNTV